MLFLSLQGAVRAGRMGLELQLSGLPVRILPCLVNVTSPICSTGRDGWEGVVVVVNFSERRSRRQKQRNRSRGILSGGLWRLGES